MIKPLHAIIAVRVDEPDEMRNGIAIPIFAREELDTGEVVAAGPGEMLNDGTFKVNPVKVGDRILLAKGSGRKMKVEGEELLFITPAEVTGILRDDLTKDGFVDEPEMRD
jgi:chaperonin GroES